RDTSTPRRRRRTFVVRLDTLAKSDVVPRFNLTTAGLENLFLSSGTLSTSAKTSSATTSIEIVKDRAAPRPTSIIEAVTDNKVVKDQAAAPSLQFNPVTVSDLKQLFSHRGFLPSYFLVDDESMRYRTTDGDEPVPAFCRFFRGQVAVARGAGSTQIIPGEIAVAPNSNLRRDSLLPWITRRKLYPENRMSEADPVGLQHSKIYLSTSLDAIATEVEWPLSSRPSGTKQCCDSREGVALQRALLTKPEHEDLFQVDADGEKVLTVFLCAGAMFSAYERIAYLMPNAANAHPHVDIICFY
ncbi:unnamed protein product, partial [Amoebophrya sp. A25]